MNKIVMDLDNTIAGPKTKCYADCKPNLEVIHRMREYQEMGFVIVIFTARNMRTYKGEVGKINVHTLPSMIAWLDRHEVPYDEILIGKPWCGASGFYVDDRSIRPDEFVRLSNQEIAELLSGAVSGNEAADEGATS